MRAKKYLLKNSLNEVGRLNHLSNSVAWVGGAGAATPPEKDTQIRHERVISLAREHRHERVTGEGTQTLLVTVVLPSEETDMVDIRRSHTYTHIQTSLL